VKTIAVIDSGSRHNVVDLATWQYLKSKSIQVLNQRSSTDKDFVAFGGGRLSFVGIFEAKIEIGSRETIADFYVFNEPGKLLLGFETAIKLEVLKMGENISQIQECEEMSKIKGVTISLPIDRQVTPVVQPYRRIPIALEDAVEKKSRSCCDWALLKR